MGWAGSKLRNRTSSKIGDIEFFEVGKDKIQVNDVNAIQLGIITASQFVPESTTIGIKNDPNFDFMAVVVGVTNDQLTTSASFIQA